jgi:hypothetical protein
LRRLDSELLAAISTEFINSHLLLVDIFASFGKCVHLARSQLSKLFGVHPSEIPLVVVEIHRHIKSFLELFALIPVPLINLRLGQPSDRRQPCDDFFGPLGALVEFLEQELYLGVVFARTGLPVFFVPPISPTAKLLLLCMLPTLIKGLDKTIKVIILHNILLRGFKRALNRCI